MLGSTFVVEDLNSLTKQVSIDWQSGIALWWEGAPCPPSVDKVRSIRSEPAARPPAAGANASMVVKKIATRILRNGWNTLCIV